MRTALYLLNIGGDYAPELTALTYPLIRHYARKIDATIFEIRERRFPGWPITYEKLQIHTMAQRNEAEWHYYLDSDALVHPDTPDWTRFLSRDTVAHNGMDFAAVRWRYNEWLERDGRNIGSCNWNTLASRWCLDLWRPLECSPDEAIDCIFPTQGERNSGVIDAPHLIDDYALSCNIARFGLKFHTLINLQRQLNLEGEFYWHAYDVPLAEKLKQMHETLDRWKVDPTRL